MTAMKLAIKATTAFAAVTACHAFSTLSESLTITATRVSKTSLASATASNAGNLHGQGSCFMPLLQNDDEYIAPRIVQIAGAYPGVTTKDYLAVSSEPPAELGQWSYDFSDPNGPQMGTIALPGMPSVHECEDPVVVIADHFSLNVQLTREIVDPVDLVVLCDRSKTYFSERKFLVFELEENAVDGVLTIGAFASKAEMPPNAKILGQVMLVQIPWLPSMQKKKSGFMEEDEYF